MLVVDVGGTKTTIAVYREDEMVYSYYFLNRDFTSFQDLLASVIEKTSCYQIASAGFAIAAPRPDSGPWIMTNLNWQLDPEFIESKLKVPVAYLNDVLALAYGVLHASQQEVDSLNRVKAKKRIYNQVVISIGTGVGQSIIIDRKMAFATEGGFSRISLRSDEEYQLLLFFTEKFQKEVFIEDVLCGKGVLNIYRWCCGLIYQDKFDDQPAVFGDFLHALDVRDPSACRALTIWTNILASHCSQVVMTTMSLGGIYLAGGVFQRLFPFFDRDLFFSRFLSKSRITHLLEDVPLFKVNHESLLLKGIRCFVLSSF